MQKTIFVAITMGAKLASNNDYYEKNNPNRSFSLCLP